MSTPSAEVHLYGKLRGVVGCQDTAADCVAWVPVKEGKTTIADVLAKLNIPLEQTSNIFLNGELSVPLRRVQPGDRVGVFPNNMALLYRWYFKKQE